MADKASGGSTKRTRYRDARAPPEDKAPPTKRGRTDGILGGTDMVVKRKSDQAIALRGGPQRTSSLLAPTMCLTGHDAAVYSFKFDPTGAFCVSGGFDRQLLFWDVQGECDNYMVLKGHKNAILHVEWSTSGRHIFSASADKTVVAWDAEVGRRVKKWAGHSSFVNSCCPERRGDSLVVSGADDGKTKLWDMRQRNAVKTFSNKFQITSVAFSDNSQQVFAGSLDNQVKAWDLRNDQVAFTLAGHTDTVTGISLSPDGSHLISNAMDDTLRMWDVRPFVPGNTRCVKIFEGHKHTYEKMLLKCNWSPDGKRVTAGSGDQMVCVWDVQSGGILYKLPGHKGSVNEVDFHPNEPVIGSGGSDKLIFLGELAN